MRPPRAIGCRGRLDEQCMRRRVAAGCQMPSGPLPSLSQEDPPCPRAPRTARQTARPSVAGPPPNAPPVEWPPAVAEASHAATSEPSPGPSAPASSGTAAKAMRAMTVGRIVAVQAAMRISVPIVTARSVVMTAGRIGAVRTAMRIAGPIAGLPTASRSRSPATSTTAGPGAAPHVSRTPGRVASTTVVMIGLALSVVMIGPVSSVVMIGPVSSVVMIGPVSSVAMTGTSRPRCRTTWSGRPWMPPTNRWH